jgi:tRNA A37 methylthiotransferase MiaB
VIGRSESYRVINFASAAAAGSLVRVRITGAGPHSLRGVEEPPRPGA